MDLDRLESKLDLSSTSCKGKQFDSEKQEGFIRTLNSVHTIVRDKLYRARHCTMEQYFSQYHKISRAQVYRLLDCHTILQELSEFPEKPLKQRICRTLKKVAPNPAARKKLWQAVLNKHGHNAVVNLTSGDITSTWKELLTTDSSLQSSLDPVDYRSSLTSPSPLLNGSLNDTFSKSPSYVSPSRSYDSKEVIKQDSVYTSSSNLKPKLPYESEKGNLVLPTRSKRQKQNAKGEQEITKRRRIKKTDVMTNSSSTSNHTYLSNAFSNSTVTQSKLPLPSTSLNSSVSTFPLIFNPNLANTSSHVSDPNYYSMLPLDSAEPKFKFSEFEEWDFEATCMSKLAVTPTLGRIGSLQGNFTNLHFSHPASMIQGQADLNSSTNASSFFSSQQKESSLSLPSEMAHPLMNVQYSDCMGSIPLPNPSNSGLFSRQSTQISKFHHPNKEITSQMALSSTSPSTFLGPCNETTSHSTVPPYLLHTPSSQAYIHLMQQGHLNSNFQYVHPNSLSLDSLFSNTTSTSLSTSSPKNSTFLHSTSGKSLEVLSKSLGLYTDTENPIDHSSTVL
ncbi:hypothetical protein HMI56_006027 [Coelomomyces lativittatus]|nr:hypothetical protein HMI56_006027 [Coelomomyces lativittatus]